MLPILFKLGPVQICSLGFFMFLGLFTASFLIWREAKREYLDHEAILDAVLIAFFAGLIGARISFILLHPDRFGFNILRWLLPSWMPGFYIYGGLIFALVFLYLINIKKKIQFFKLLDVVFPGFLFSAILYKLGQWLDGSLIGLQTTSFIGMPVVGEEGLFIPVALIEALIFFLIFIFIVKKRSYFFVQQKTEGILFLTGLALTSLVETVMFFLLRDKLYYWRVIPVSLVLALGAFLVSIILLYKRTRVLKNDIKGFSTWFGLIYKNLKLKAQKTKKKTQASK